MQLPFPSSSDHAGNLSEHREPHDSAYGFKFFLSFFPPLLFTGHGRQAFFPPHSFFGTSVQQVSETGHCRAPLPPPKKTKKPSLFFSFLSLRYTPPPPPLSADGRPRNLIRPFCFRRNISFGSRLVAAAFSLLPIRKDAFFFWLTGIANRLKKCVSFPYLPFFLPQSTDRSSLFFSPTPFHRCIGLVGFFPSNYGPCKSDKLNSLLLPPSPFARRYQRHGAALSLPLFSFRRSSSLLSARSCRPYHLFLLSRLIGVYAGFFLSFPSTTGRQYPIFFFFCAKEFTQHVVK